MIDSGPVRLTVIYPVRDFDEFAKVFAPGARAAGDGVLSRRIFRSLDDPNEVMFEIEVASLAQAKQLIKGQGVREMLDRLGAEIYPPVFIGGEVSDLRFEAGT